MIVPVGVTLRYAILSIMLTYIPVMLAVIGMLEPPERGCLRCTVQFTQFLSMLGFVLDLCEFSW